MNIEGPLFHVEQGPLPLGGCSPFCLMFHVEQGPKLAQLEAHIVKSGALIQD
jgi:hypothetical protein